MNFSKFHVEINSDLAWRLFLLFAAACALVAASDSAFAQASTTATDNDVIGQTLCRLVANLSGGIARAIATIAIFVVGVGLFLGRLNWGTGLATVVGVAIIFSADKLVAFLTGDADNANCDTGE